MSQPGENADMILETVEPQVDMIVEEEDQQSQTEKRKRGPTMCTKTSEAKDLQIEFDKTGCPKGPRRAEYTNWCNNLVKQKASILVERWDKFDDEDKNEWWNIVKVKKKNVHALYIHFSYSVCYFFFCWIQVF